MHKFTSLPDYSAIKKLAAALHRMGSNQHGAAIMIGAGFSRTAARHVGSDRRMPLWNAFSKKLLSELNPSEKDVSFSDPLRVAEEYRSYFGQAALNDQIRAQINDEAWEPSPLYESLLKLPWSEVMTTNWDTLLERAAAPIHGPYYTPVTRPSDLAWAPSPRIVKLHGTIGTTDTFIATQEDFRTYPEKFAPFVNFARQVFIENELCLLGFSGDDPNFLQWAGWVRDHLASHARKIYLVGALNLTASQRVYLESINIAPVDLWGAVEYLSDRDTRHQAAIQMFLDAMLEVGKSKAMPHEWSPSSLVRQRISPEDYTRTFKDHAYAAELLKGQLAAMQSSRESYPGWLVCPPSLQQRLKRQLIDPPPNPNNIAALPPDERAKLLYEIAWRHSIGFDHVPSWLAELLFEVASEEGSCVLSKRQQMEIAVTLLKSSRWLIENKNTGQKKLEEYVKALIALLEKNGHTLPDSAAEIAYYRCLIAQDSFDYGGVEASVEDVRGEDPVWKLRRATLLMTLGRFDESHELLATAYGELRRIHRRDLHSIPILSRLMWAHFLLNAARLARWDLSKEDLPDFVERNFRKWKCDPRIWIDEVEEKANEKEKLYFSERNPIEPLFEQGHYKNNASSRPEECHASEYLLLEGLTREVGIPLCSGSSGARVPLLTESAGKLALSSGADLFGFTLAIRAAGSEDSRSIQEVFSRIGVALAPKELVEILVDRLTIAIDYWRQKCSHGTADQKAHASSALRVLIEVLSRLAVRVSPVKAKQLFRLALSLGSQPETQHHWLHSAIGHLLTHSLSSIPKAERDDLLTKTLSFPLQDELIDVPLLRWPNPYIDSPNERVVDADLDNRIRQLIAKIGKADPAARTDALVRLFPLVEKDGFLTQAERTSLAVAIWGDNPDYNNLPRMNLFPGALLRLPTQDESRVELLIRQYLYEQSEEVLMDTRKELRQWPSIEIERAINVYTGMAYAAINAERCTFPTSAQATVLFDQLVLWRPEKIKEDFLGEITRSRNGLANSLGDALSYAISPALSIEDRTLERFEKLRLFAEEIEEGFSAISALIYFVKVGEKVALTVEKIIQQSMQSRDSNRVAHASLAIKAWVKSSKERSPTLLRLISRLIAIIESGRTIGLQQLILLADELLKEEWLTDEQISTLLEATLNAFHAANYAHIDPKGRDAINASSIRQACVKLTMTLLIAQPDVSGLQELIQDSESDPLPEVRFASIQDDE